MSFICTNLETLIDINNKKISFKRVELNSHTFDDHLADFFLQKPIRILIGEATFQKIVPICKSVTYSRGVQAPRSHMFTLIVKLTVTNWRPAFFNRQNTYTFALTGCIRLWHIIVKNLSKKLFGDQQRKYFGCEPV